MSNDFASKPRGEFSDKPGNYELAVRNLKPILNPGDVLEVQLFITGYGIIKGSKLTAYPSSDIFDEDNSRVVYGFKTEDNKIVFGGQTSGYSKDGITLYLSGATSEENLMFYDTHTPQRTSVPQIVSETRQKSPPIQFILNTRKEVRPGNYQLHFHLTYFNGVEWKGSKEEAHFTVRNILQRHEGQVALVSTIAGGIAILVFVLSHIKPAIDFISLFVEVLTRKIF